MSPCLLSFDVGTTAIKVGLFSSEGTLLSMRSREQVLQFQGADRIEQSPSQGLQLLAEITRELMLEHDPKEVVALSISNHRGTAIALDSDGSPLSEFIIWMDKRGLPWVEWLRENVGPEDYYQICGHPIVSYTGISKLLWFQHSAPEIWQTASVIAAPQTFFLKWLGSDDLVCDVSTGSFLFPLDIDRQTWSELFADQIDFPLDKLPRLVKATDIVGYLNTEAAEALGLEAGVPLVAGGGDGQCAGVGSGVIKPGRVMVNIGTATGVQTFLVSPIRDPQCTLNCAAHVVTGVWEMEGHTQASGAALRWLRDTFGGQEMARQQEDGRNAYDLLVEQAGLSKPGAAGLLFIPTFNGSSAPIVDMTARGSLLGLSLSHSKGDVIRALLEGISLEIRWMLDAMIDMGMVVDEIRLVGGGASNPTWNQIHADILGKPVQILLESNVALVGAAICAAMAVGLYADWDTVADHFVHPQATIDPQSEHRAVYQQRYDSYRDAFMLLSQSGIFGQLKP